MSSMRIRRFDRALSSEAHEVHEVSSRIVVRLRSMDVIIAPYGAEYRSRMLVRLDLMVKGVREMLSRRHDDCNTRETGISLIDD